MRPLLCLLIPIILDGLWAGKSAPALGAPRDQSFRHEIQRAIDKGTAWLTANQQTNGCWSTADHPAVTALALQALLGDPGNRFQRHSSISNGFRYVLSCAKPDGSIYASGLANYNTSLSLMACVAAKDPKFDPVIRNARRWLIGQQVDLGERGRIDTPFDGGVGYGSAGDHSDMNNTLSALEALYYTRHIPKDANKGSVDDLNWAAAIEFLQNCQNLPASNHQDWVSGDPKNKGGFIYYPGRSMSGAETNAAGRVALRSYGSISYAGLLSFIYADVKRDDPRVVAVFDWLRDNFSLDENPGMGPQGYFYYLHLMTKGLNSYGTDRLELSNGKKVDWRREVAMKLMSLQKEDGSWINPNPRWWEKDPALVTAYSLLTLEIVYRGL